MRDIADKLIKTGCYIKTDDTFKTTYGDEVIAYLCCRLAISNVEVRQYIIDKLATQIHDRYGNDVTIAGMATAGIPWATGVAEKLNCPLLYLRSKPKDYGLKNLIEGNLDYVTNKIIVMDDILYTGKTAQIGIDALTEKDLKVVDIAAIVKLSDTAEENITNKNIDVTYLTDYKEILDSALENKILTKEEKNIMLNIYRK